MPNKYFAAIDLGTNSCRLVIADEKRNYVYKDTRPVRLGEGMAADMRFTPEAMQRGFEALADFQKHICAYNCCKVRASRRLPAGWPATAWILCAAWQSNAVCSWK